jgi:hypothetical protein
MARPAGREPSDSIRQQPVFTRTFPNLQLTIAVAILNDDSREPDTGDVEVVDNLGDANSE